MAYDGNGVFSRPVSDYVFDTVISETDVNLEMNGIATGLSSVITKNGQTAITANLPMSGYRHTGVGAASARTHYATVAQVQDGDYTELGSVSGTDTITASASPAITAYVAGQRFTFVASGTNTGATTLNINSVGAVAIEKRQAALAAGDIASGDVVDVFYDGATFQMLSPINVAVLGTAAVLNVGTGANEIVQRDSNGDYPSGNGSAITNIVSPFPQGHLYGLRLSNDTDTDHDILVAAGECRDDTNADNLLLGTAIAKQIDATWAVGDDAGGLDTGSVTTDETYHVWLIKRSDTGVVDALFSLSASSPTMPANYDLKRRIGAVLTDGSSNIRQFTQFGDHFILHSVVEDSTTVDTSASSFAVTVPTGVNVEWEGIIYTAASALSWTYPTFVDDEAVGSSRNQNTADTSVMATRIWTDTSAQLRAISNSGGGVSVIYGTRGWIDRRGKDS